MKIMSRAKLTEYIGIELGAPVIKINVAPVHYDNAIDEALEIFFEYSDQGSEKIYFAHVITEADISSRIITMPDYIDEVFELIPVDSASVSSHGAAFGTYAFEFNKSVHDDLFRSGAGGNMAIVDYQVYNMYAKMTSDIMGGNNTTPYTYNRITKKLRMEWAPVLGELVVLACDAPIASIDDPDFESEIYNHEFVRKFSTASLKKKWSNILKKYDNVKIPGGVTLNGKEMYDEAMEELKDIEDDFKKKNTPPSPFFLM